LRNKRYNANRTVKNLQAPQKNTLELYFKEKVLYKMEDNGVETPIGGWGASAAPGWTWGFHGTAVANRWLYNDEVPSSATGRVLQFSRPILRKVLVNCVSSSGTCELSLRTHDGNVVNDAEILRVVLNGVTEKVQNVNIPLTSGKQLAVKVVQGECQHPVVGIFLDGLY
jgi:hypothetical protein